MGMVLLARTRIRWLSVTVPWFLVSVGPWRFGPARRRCWISHSESDREGVGNSGCTECIKPPEILAGPAGIVGTVYLLQVSQKALVNMSDLEETLLSQHDGLAMVLFTEEVFRPRGIQLGQSDGGLEGVTNLAAIPSTFLVLIKVFISKVGDL